MGFGRGLDGWSRWVYVCRIGACMKRGLGGVWMGGASGCMYGDYGACMEWGLGLESGVAVPHEQCYRVPSLGHVKIYTGIYKV